MFRRYLWLAAFVTLVFGTSARADFLVQTARIHTSTGGATTVGTLMTDGGVNLVNGNTSLGNQFINNTTTNTAASAGSVVVVGSNLLASYGFQFGGGMGAVYNPAGAPMQPLVAVFALAGSVGSGTSTIFTAATGRIGLFSIGGTLVSNGYNEFNPLTWGAVNAAGTVLLTPVAVWDLKPPEPVIDLGVGVPSGGGPGGVFNLSPAQVNQISVNTAVGSANQGFFLFRETQNSTFASSPGALSGNSFVTVIGNPPIVPPGTSFLDEGIVSRIDESYRRAVAAITGSISGGPGSAGFDALNTIASVLGGLPVLTGGSPGQAFATAFGGIGNSGGSGTSYNPSGGTPVPDTSDLFFTLGTTTGVGTQVVVPEPSSVVLYSLMTAGLGLFSGLRRYRGQKIVVA